VRIRVLGGMGRKGWSEVHPFTIASAGGGEGIELYVKAAGDWTTKLASFARASSASQGLPVAAKRRTMQLIKNLGSGRVVNVLVEGPYGGPGHTIISSYSAALVLCGGSGVSFGLGVVDEIVKDAEMGRARVRFAEMVWVTSDPGSSVTLPFCNFYPLFIHYDVLVSVVPLLPTFTALLSRASKLLGLSLQITVYYTKAQPLDAFPSFALSPPPLFFAHEGDEDEKEASPEPTVREKAPPKAFELPPRLSVHPTRPSIEVHLNALINLTKSLKHGAGTHGLLIATCGTDGLSEGARKAESSIEGWVRKEIGGIEFFDEGFSC
jgi:ferric-chelate reductase